MHKNKNPEKVAGQFISIPLQGSSRYVRHTQVKSPKIEKIGERERERKI
jgi:hypothetical protein